MTLPREVGQQCFEVFTLASEIASQFVGGFFIPEIIRCLIMVTENVIDNFFVSLLVQVRGLSRGF